MAKSLEISFIKTQQWKELNFWTKDESWIIWIISHWIFVTTRPGDASENSTEISAKKSILTIFSLAGFLILDVMPQHIIFTAEYFITQILTQFHQHRMSLLQDATWRKFNLHFDNSQWHIARSVTDEMIKWWCKQIAHHPYSPDLAIRDFHLFSHLKDKLACFHVDDYAKFFQEVQRILRVVDWTKVKVFLDSGSSDVSRLPRTKMNIILNNNELHFYFSLLIFTFVNI
jgi:hypothetical protein